MAHNIQNKKMNLTGIIIIVCILILLAYAGLDAFKIRPNLNQRVDSVTVQFATLKVYLDKKLPQIDSLLIVHTGQIEEQNIQLIELNQLTKVLKEK
jgi:hypothetical protein